MSAVTQLGANTGGTTIGPGVTCFFPMGETGISGGDFSTVEAESSLTHRLGGVYSRLYARISANGLTATSTIRIRKNGVTGAQVLTIGSGATGDFSDDTNETTVIEAAGDTINGRIFTGATGTTITVRAISLLFSATTNTAKKFVSHRTASQAASISNYIGLSGSVAHTTEAEARSRCDTPGTLSNFNVYVTANSRSTSTLLRVRNNSANTSLFISVGAGATGEFEDVDSTTIAANDLVNYSVVTGGGTGTISVRILAVDYVTTNGQSHILSQGSVNFAAAGGDLFSFLGGPIANNVTENIREGRVGIGFTASKLRAYVTANGVTATTTLTMRVNGVDTALTLSIGSGATGEFNDSTHSVAVAADDKISAKLAMGASGTTLTLSQIGILCTSASGAVGKIFSGRIYESLVLSGRAFGRRPAQRPATYMRRAA